jgi:hypothetical protein
VPLLLQVLSRLATRCRLLLQGGAADAFVAGVQRGVAFDLQWLQEDESMAQVRALPRVAAALVVAYAGRAAKAAPAPPPGAQEPLPEQGAPTAGGPNGGLTPTHVLAQLAGMKAQYKQQAAPLEGILASHGVYHLSGSNKPGRAVNSWQNAGPTLAEARALAAQRQAGEGLAGGGGPSTYGVESFDFGSGGGGGVEGGGGSGSGSDGDEPATLEDFDAAFEEAYGGSGGGGGGVAGEGEGEGDELEFERLAYGEGGREGLGVGVRAGGASAGTGAAGAEQQQARPAAHSAAHPAAHSAAHPAAGVAVPDQPSQPAQPPPPPPPLAEEWDCLEVEEMD